MRGGGQLCSYNVPAGFTFAAPFSNLLAYWLFCPFLPIHLLSPAGTEAGSHRNSGHSGLQGLSGEVRE